MEQRLATRFWLAALCPWLALASAAPARTTPDPGNPLGFFTTVADKMLRSTFPFGVTNIPVCSNGVYVYTPAVQRLLQFSANVLDASNTNAFPSVFRPLFGKDAGGNIFVIGYLQVTNVSGTSDPQLSLPYDPSALVNYTGAMPITNSQGPVNIYGVPWIIGAKKGLPNFNQFYMLPAVQVTRKLQLTRTAPYPSFTTYSTNEMYVIGISNSVGVSFWNSYSVAYPRPLTVVACDWVNMVLTNGYYLWAVQTNFTTTVAVNTWPGTGWTPSTVVTGNPNSGSFLIFNWGYLFQSPLTYSLNTHSFDVSGNWDSPTPPLQELTQFGLNVTNYLQAFILDGTNVIDYVQLLGPNGSGSLNQALADPNYPQPSNVFLQWSTNYYGGVPQIPFGVINQMVVSGDPSKAPVSGGQWSSAPTPMGETTPYAEAAYFNGFFAPSFQYNGQIYVNNQLAIQAPYTPSRTVYTSFLLQANDPLVHYLSSDLNGQAGTTAVWNRYSFVNGNWTHVDDSTSTSFPVPPSTPIGGRYQPWLHKGQMEALLPKVISVTNNYAVKDPLLESSDNWDFPTNLLSALSGLGQVHRGTPWQTFYLKDVDLLNNSSPSTFPGTNTWVQWTGDLSQNDAALMAPLQDRPLAGLLMSLLNTNDPTQLFSVNDPNIADWLNLLNGLTVYSNSAPSVQRTTPVTFDTYVLDGSSSQAAVFANGIALARAGQNNARFQSIGDVCAAPELSRNSPFINLGSTSFGQQQMNYGITDWEYEALPAQLLALLRPDLFGALLPTNGGWDVSFSGADGYTYAVQTSTNLADWITLSTNSPVQGSFTLPVTVPTNVGSLYFRSVLLR